MSQDPAAMVVLLAGGEIEVARWPLMVAGRVDLAVVEQLSRLQLAARRMGCSLQLHDMCDELTELLAFLGLAKAVTGVVAEVVGLPSQVSGESEDREQRGVEEVVVTDDPVA